MLRSSYPLLAAVSLVLLSSCGRTIEDEEPRELVEHRIEPCTQWCTNQLDPECGANIEDHPWRRVDDCLEDCAAVDPLYNWEWGPRGDGTDACVEEWIATSECINALSCEDRRAFYRRPGAITEYACKEEFAARSRCFRSALEDGGT